MSPALQGRNMGQFINHHSFLLFGGLLLLVWAVVLLARHARRGWILWGVALLVLAAAWLALRTGGDRQPQTLAEIETALSRGQPVLVEIYSDY